MNKKSVVKKAKKILKGEGSVLNPREEAAVKLAGDHSIIELVEMLDAASEPDEIKQIEDAIRASLELAILMESLSKEEIDELMLLAAQFLKKENN